MRIKNWKEQIFREIDRIAPEIITHSDSSQLNIGTQDIYTSRGYGCSFLTADFCR